MNLLTNGQGAVMLAKSYPLYGETLASPGNGSSPFAFTGEQTDVSGMTYLRARYYSSGTGRFLTRDTWMGEYNRPLSLNRWGYVEGNPINRVDPSGYSWQTPNYCQMMPTKGLYEYCILTKYRLEPIDPFNLGATVTGYLGCYSGPTAYRAPGYIEGADIYYGGWPMDINGTEVVYDFATLERATFKYFGGMIGISVNFIGGGLYSGHVNGFKSVESPSNIVSDYRDVSLSISYGVSVGLGLGRTAFVSSSDWMLNGKTTYISFSFGVGLLEPLDLSVAIVTYSPTSSITSYAANGIVDRGRLANDIFSGADSPGSWWKTELSPYGLDTSRPIIFTDYTLARVLAWIRASHYADAYEAMWEINHGGN